ncbi:MULTISPECIES: inner membrane-spanning protein YciB [unclassified Sphingopyxis]|jgi:intracellular septation protein|uniref:inner membrane-spanning protein YciB n=1 Tax=unclassified Sphingopyxis TaxID=2614943 RepID=UPI00073061F8|nr:MULTISPECIES: inner membrane-spanning protein YciB [unclassified Sphingopyxis]KTE25897.1 septation protein A [Sphingopyxis sp. H057]KTE51577.1 septation protein A [Sphingopyxis sp. H073]KTE53920.1 septation protein A [Sphingopyxis sp. H071]KTE58923.1 septation protein A [Sphingopyxis sp. H107]KTE65544.1 septation protein A [Sphingopyxis sp. H100]
MSEQIDQLPGGPEPIPAPPPAKHGWLNFAIDFGPLLVFFLTYKFSSGGTGAFAATTGAIKGTVAFMAAIIVAMIVSKWKLGRISPMLWMSSILVLGFGALTIWFHDERFIVMKPTIIYAAFAVLLLGGWLLKKPMLKYLLQSALEGVTERGWLLLSRNWGLFFAALGVANHVMYELIQAKQMSFDLWLTIKVWGVTALSFLFTLTQVPVMLKHGLAVTEGADKQA